MIDRADVQGIVLLPYRWQPFARFYFVSFEGGDPRAWLARVLCDVSSAASSEGRERLRRNVAFTASGLARLGLTDEFLESFPREFLQGMAHPERALSLGDGGPNAPEHWELGGPRGERIDALFCVYAPTSAELEREGDAAEELLERLRLSAVSEDVHLPEDGRDHFGHALSQPEPRLGTWALQRRDRENRPLPPGEILLGHKNARGYVSEGPRAPIRSGTRPRPRLTDYGRAVDLGYNGTYLVVRKLEQDVLGFSRTPSVAAPAPSLPPERLRSHRLFDRSRLYGERLDPASPESAEEERGVMFVGVNANLRRQFEFVHGALLGGSSPAPGSPQSYARVRGGAYLFMPGLTALGYLTEL